ncbi:hypothetical protein KDL01_35740 [Actinospica durhamensis]|uniref:Uncharacterized protein n=1 Tax=Actinospica durhamensis TaxID=1508375 RepID=A0A941IW70_9ACTN|nr:hypothetical protein [Actinospica durhamensis]MBR7838676.1 hypothetical protein [Actinospica durhamensis]
MASQPAAGSESQADRFRFPIRDHGAQFTLRFDSEFHATGIRIVTTGIQTPVTNASQERRYRSVGAELLDRTSGWTTNPFGKTARCYQAAFYIAAIFLLRAVRT